MSPRIARHAALVLGFATVAVASPAAAQAPDAIPAKYREIANRIIAAAEADSTDAWDRIAELTDRFGHRPSGWMRSSRRSPGRPSG